MAKMYDYLVHYTFNKDGYLTPCTGTIGISRKNKISNFDELNSVRDFIVNSIEGAKNLSIDNFILLGRNKH